MDHRQLLIQKAAELTDSEIAEVLEFIAMLESISDQGRRPDLSEDDPILKILSDAGFNFFPLES